MFLNYKSIYQSKEQSKVAAKKLLALLEPILASGSLVDNVEHKDGKSVYYLTKLNFSPSAIHDFSHAQEILTVLSKSWTWRLSSAHTGRFTLAYEEGFIEFLFIDVSHNEDEAGLACNFFVRGDSELEAATRLEGWLQGSLLRWETLHAKEYFKIEQCYVVTVSIRLASNTFDEVREVLLGITGDWSAIGLKAYTDECAVDRDVLAMEVSFKETKL
ncbi:hypothetical protein [Paenibacillus radicis (ex Gao et al. 2016)]|uniref:Uncharacterized protein n=1 Tax=Paenibacillus radicis (ex Gao et al. 2016) TaxID=1737354 RepID=A0A917LS53_9BACL|nr:hypothetical protein [Paenibacillus radicis (ex Gao et al. 2016)]GGG53768.1 hypothetical protein GCM10010918_03190 [Paenibacillus radicis (ex Gao et al. 2016)]